MSRENRKEIKRKPRKHVRRRRELTGAGTLLWHPPPRPTLPKATGSGPHGKARLQEAGGSGSAGHESAGAWVGGGWGQWCGGDGKGCRPIIRVPSAGEKGGRGRPHVSADQLTPAGAFCSWATCSALHPPAHGRDASSPTRLYRPLREGPSGGACVWGGPAFIVARARV